MPQASAGYYPGPPPPPSGSLQENPGRRRGRGGGAVAYSFVFAKGGLPTGRPGTGGVHFPEDRDPFFRYIFVLWPPEQTPTARCGYPSLERMLSSIKTLARKVPHVPRQQLRSMISLSETHQVLTPGSSCCGCVVVPTGAARFADASGDDSTVCGQDSRTHCSTLLPFCLR